MKTILIVLIALFISMSLSAADKTAVVLMHGKSGTSSEYSPVGQLAEFLRENDLLVATPDMPWSRERFLEKDYEASMNEIDDIVADLKGQGATRIVVGGHSMGANAALGYAARREGMAGVLAIAPGHVPELGGFQNKMDNDWQRAKAMVDAGKGDVIAEFKDVNQGRVKEKAVRADIYLSWFSPTGPAVIPVNVSNLKEGTAMLWIIGERDRMYDRGEEYAYSSAPSNEKNAYVVVKGGHKVTPKKGKQEILEWLRRL